MEFLFLTNGLNSWQMALRYVHLIDFKYEGDDAVIKLEWGTKRACQSCAARFYDMRRSPIICPKCGETFEIQTPGRRSRSRAAMGDVAAKPLEDDLLIPDLDLPADLDADLVEGDEDALIDDAADLDEGLDELDGMASVIDTIDEGEEQ